jgi:DNA-binding transcriptional regulator YhcF (GntR family)
MSSPGATAQQESSQKLWKPRELAKRLNVNYNTVLRYLKDGIVAHINIGGRKYITDAEVTRILTQGTTDDNDSDGPQQAAA